MIFPLHPIYTYTITIVYKTYPQMPSKAEVINLADDDFEEEYESIPIPDDIEVLEAMPTAGPSRKRESKSTSMDNSYNLGEEFDEKQRIRGKIEKLRAEVRAYSCQKLTQ
jgi:hypothetical protein